MNTRSKLAALLAAGALAFALGGVAFGASVVPVLHDGNITAAGGGNNDTPDCAVGDRIEIAGPTTDTDGADASGTSTNGVTVNIDYHSDDKGFDFTVEGGTVTIAYVKGSNAYNGYHYGSPGVTSDTDLFAPDNASGGPAKVSHTVWCTAAGEAPSDAPSFAQSFEGETDAPSFAQSFEGETDAPSEPNTATIGGNGTSGPADGAWLLVVALGVLLASIVVLTPARAKSRR